MIQRMYRHKLYIREIFIIMRKDKSVHIYVQFLCIHIQIYCVFIRVNSFRLQNVVSK